MTKQAEVTLNDIVKFARADVDKTQSAVAARATLIDSLIAAGYTFENTAPYTAKDLREGKVSNANVMYRGNMFYVCAAAVKINGKRLSDADLQRFMDDEVSNKTMLSGYMKGNVSGERTWKGDATSHMGKLRNELKARQDAGKDAPKGNARTAKTDTDAILASLQVAYNRTFKADVTIKADPAEVQKAMRAVATLLGARLAQPKAK